MKALITGGAGFIGSHLAEALCRNGAEVVIIDNFSSGRIENLGWFRNGDKVELIKGDVIDEVLVRKAIGGCDWVFHHAAMPSVPFSVERPWETNEYNLTASLKLLLLARDAKVKRFMFASSSAIYGDSSAPIKTETDVPNPQSPYALQKYGAEKYGQLFHRLYGLETVSFRYFNVFGPRQSFDSPYSGVIAKFCTIALAGGTPTVYGDGQQCRDFTAIQNVVEANLKAVEAPAKEVAGRIFNIGTGQTVTLIELLAEIRRLTGQKITPEFRERRVGDVQWSRADISAAKSAFGYQVKTSWEEGLRETIAFYRKSG